MLYQSRVANELGVIWSSTELVFNALFNTIEINTSKDLRLTPLEGAPHNWSLHIKLMHWETAISTDASDYTEALKVLYTRSSIADEGYKFPLKDIEQLISHLDTVNRRLPRSM
jgi:hypothetical protein